MDVRLDVAYAPERFASLVQQWTHALLRAAISLEALKITATSAPCSPVLGFPPNLKYVELRLQEPQECLGSFFVDLRFCSCLESFKITQYDHLTYETDPQKLPEVQQDCLPNLKRVELMGWLPGTEFTLPPHCKLRVEVECGASLPWKEQWRAMQGYLTMLLLDESGLKGWPAGLERLSQLMYLELRCTGFRGDDLAVLKAIPHVDLFLDGVASLILSNGTWQSLKVESSHALCVTFADADAFVRGTERFLFASTGNTKDFSQHVPH